MAEENNENRETDRLISNERNNDRPIPLYQKASYGLGHVFNDLCSSMWFSYILLFLQIVLKIQATIAGALLLLGQVVDGLATPVAGYLVDKIGSRKLWHVVGTVLVALSFPLIFVACSECEPGSIWELIYYSFFISIFQIGWALVQISHLSMIPDIPGPHSQRAELTAIRYTASVCSSVFVYIVTWMVLHAQSGTEKFLGPQDLNKFKTVAFIVTAVGIITTAIFYLGVRKTNHRICVNNADNFESPEKTNLKKLKKKMFTSPLLYQISLLYVAARLFLTLTLVYMPLYLDERQTLNVSTDTKINGSVTDVASSEVEEIASVPLVSYLASFIASLCLKHWSQCSRKVAYFLGSMLGLIGCTWIAVIIDPNATSIHVYISAILLGAGSAITIVTSLNITADLIGPHTEQGAFVYSTVTFADKVITGLAVVIIEHIKCTDPLMCPEYYRKTLSYACGGVALLGLLVLSSLIKTRL